jgi:hypothetical protein
MESKTKKKIALSPAKLAANRANALKSTGPRTVEGQRRSAANAQVTHGYCTNEPKFSEANLAEIAEIEIHLTEQWQPATPESSALVHEMATATWRMDEILMTIDEALSNPGLNPMPNAQLARYLAAAQAVRRRARKALQANLQAPTQTAEPEASDLRQRTQTAEPEASDLRQRTQTAEPEASDLAGDVVGLISNQDIGREPFLLPTRPAHPSVAFSRQPIFCTFRHGNIIVNKIVDNRSSLR